MLADLATTPDRPVREPKRRRGLVPRLYLSLWKRLNFLGHPAVALLRLVETVFGPRGVTAILAPAIGVEILHRLVDYSAFKRLRRILPDEFWGGLTPWRHFVRMIRNWESTLATNLICDRLTSPAWKNYLAFTGVPPGLMQELNRRPVILIHLHTGGYGTLNRWLRAHRFASVCFRSGNPVFFDNPWVDRLFESADRETGLLDVPQCFAPGEVRAMRRFLVPGHILTVAIDAETDTSDLFSANGHPICLSQGIVRLAAASNALLIPVSVLSKGIVQFEFKFGAPVPDQLVDARNPRPAIQFLLDQLWKDVEADPSLLGWSTLLVLDLRSKPNHLPWP